MLGVGWARGCALGLSTLGSQPGKGRLSSLSGLLGLGALAIVIAAPRTEGWMVALTALIVALWAATTARHFLVGAPGGPSPHPAS